MDHPAFGALTLMPRVAVLFLCLASLALAKRSKEMEKSIQDQRNELQALRQQLADGRKRVKELESQAKRQEGAVQQIRENEKLTATVLKKIDAAEAQYRQLLEESRGELDEARKDLDDRRGILAQRVRRIWMRGRPDPGLAWLGQDDPDEWLRRKKAFQAVVEADRRLLGQVRHRGQVLTERVQSHQRRVAGLQEIEAAKSEELAALGQTRVGEEKKLATIQDRAGQERDRLKKLEAAQAAIQTLLTTLERKRKEEEKRYAESLKQQKKDREKAKVERVAQRKKDEEEAKKARKAGKKVPEPKVTEAPEPKEEAPVQTSLPQGAAPARKGMYWPVRGRILSRFGLQKNAVLGTTTRNLGVEIAGNQGQPVVAASGGKVAAILHLPGRGTTLVVEHPGGYFTLYGHLSKVLAREGATAGAGKEIGLVGSDESIDGAKLYFELRKGLSALDPLEWLTR